MEDGVGEGERRAGSCHYLLTLFPDYDTTSQDELQGRMWSVIVDLVCGIISRLSGHNGWPCPLSGSLGT